jgi:hypothetical protein
VAVEAATMTATIIGEAGGCYAYACPTCKRREGRVAGGRILQVLAASGAAVLSLADPAALERRPSVGPLGVEEVERVARQLDDDAWFLAALDALGDQSVEP